MLMTNFLKDRRSVREFKNKKINFSVIEDIKLYLKILEEEANDIKFRLYENGDYIYDRLNGISGYAGIMIESPHYIALQQIKEDKATTIYGAYYMEKLITELNRLGVETCWVSVGDIEEKFKNKVFGEHIGNISYILAIGYGKRRNPFTNEPSSERMGVEEIVYSASLETRVDNQELEHRGLDDLFYYVRFAPSNANLQPWRFLLGKDKVTLFIKYSEGETPNLVDAGIIMYYFKELAKSIRIENDWKLLDGNYTGEDGIYEYVAEMKL